MLQLALQIMEGEQGQEPVEVAKTLTLLADALLEQGQPAAAVERLQRAVAIAEVEHGKEVAVMLKIMGGALLEQGLTVEAVRTLQRALEMAEVGKHSGLVEAIRLQLDESDPGGQQRRPREATVHFEEQQERAEEAPARSAEEMAAHAEAVAALNEKLRVAIAQKGTPLLEAFAEMDEDGDRLIVRRATARPDALERPSQQTRARASPRGCLTGPKGVPQGHPPARRRAAAHRGRDRRVLRRDGRRRQRLDRRGRV